MEPWDKDDFLDMWRGLFPPEYTQPIEQQLDGEGLDPVAAFGAIFARVETATNYTTQRYYLKPHSLQTGEPAAGAAKAVGEVDISRVAPVDQALTLVAGTVLQATYRDTVGTTREGPTYVLLEDAVFAAGDLGPVTIEVEASRVGYAYNLEAGSITLFQALGESEIEDATISGTTLTNGGNRDRLSESMLGRFVFFDTGPNAGGIARIVGVSASLQTAILDRALSAGTGDARVLEFADLGLTVEQPAELSGGRDGWLDAIGIDRRVYRRTGEDDEAYRLRVCELPDSISPAAVLRAARRILDPLGIRFALKETRDPDSWPGFVLDIDPFDVLNEFGGWVGGCEILTAFVLCVSADNALDAFGLVYDEAPSPGQAAWDKEAFDGYSVGYVSALASLYDAIEAIRAAGVCWTLALDPAL
jgi:hypothetical protein